MCSCRVAVSPMHAKSPPRFAGGLCFRTYRRDWDTDQPWKFVDLTVESVYSTQLKVDVVAAALSLSIHWKWLDEAEKAVRVIESKFCSETCSVEFVFATFGFTIV